jgi:hypothetical protein
MCVGEYAFAYGTKNCILCNSSSQFIYDSICYDEIIGCQIYNTTNPSLCILCKSNYIGHQCNICSSGFFMYKPGYCGAILLNCTEYVQNTLNCQNCSGDLSPPNCITCNKGYFMSNESGCQACSNNGCEDCNNTSCYSC